MNLLLIANSYRCKMMSCSLLGKQKNFRFVILFNEFNVVGISMNIIRWWLHLNWSCFFSFLPQTEFNLSRRKSNIE